jgi:SAM-dependent methyltransferase
MEWDPVSLLKGIRAAFSGRTMRECNICGHSCKRFQSNQWHRYIICPKCGSQVRHRLLVAALTRIESLHKDKLLAGKAVLHFAPEEFLKPFFAEGSGKYIKADLIAPGYDYRDIDVQVDISNMDGIPNGAYDVCIAIDVLEHVPDDRAAVREVHRILKPGGYGILSVPQKDNLERTIDDPFITDPDERLLKFGQRDHLRIYGLDFKDMLAGSGFEVYIVDENSFKAAFVKRHVLRPPVRGDHPFVTNFRRVYFARKP